MHDCRAKLTRFAADNLPTAKAARPDMPPSLTDREVDNWRTQFRIASVLGEVWSEILWQTAEVISARASLHSGDDAALLLLSDCRDVYQPEGRVQKPNKEDWIKSQTLLSKLLTVEERWYSDEKIPSTPVVWLVSYGTSGCIRRATTSGVTLTGTSRRDTNGCSSMKPGGATFHPVRRCVSALPPQNKRYSRYGPEIVTLLPFQKGQNCNGSFPTISRL